MDTSALAQNWNIYKLKVLGIWPFEKSRLLDGPLKKGHTPKVGKMDFVHLTVHLTVYLTGVPNKLCKMHFVHQSANVFEWGIV